MKNDLLSNVQSLATRLEWARAARLAFMLRLYQLSGGEHFPFPVEEIAMGIKVPDDSVDAVVAWLAGEKLLVASKETVRLTHKGVVQIEAAIERPGSATKYFPAVASIASLTQAN